jgi:hypothetical protein
MFAAARAGGGPVRCPPRPGPRSQRKSTNSGTWRRWSLGLPCGYPVKASRSKDARTNLSHGQFPFGIRTRVLDSSFAPGHGLWRRPSAPGTLVGDNVVDRDGVSPYKPPGGTHLESPVTAVLLTPDGRRAASGLSGRQPALGGVDSGCSTAPRVPRQAAPPHSSSSALLLVRAFPTFLPGTGPGDRGQASGRAPGGEAARFRKPAEGSSGHLGRQPS